MDNVLTNLGKGHEPFVDWDDDDSNDDTEKGSEADTGWKKWDRI